MEKITRRDYLKWLGAGTVSAALAPSVMGETSQQKPVTDGSVSGLMERQPLDGDQARRLAWWHEARFGMFIHWGLYSVLGRHEWAMEMEGISAGEYSQLAKKFKPKPNAARDWARLAKAAGQKYMVLTTKHHEGFCLFDTKTTNFCAPKQGPGRDLVKEYVEAARAEGLRVGFYYSLMDWHHPDGSRCKQDEAARKRFVEYIHTQIRELMTNYGKIDILWYDVAYPLTKEGWESDKMNEMVFSLQPDIIINNRNDPKGKLGDFSTPEQKIEAAEEGRAWEACMTLNDSWGYQRADDAWKTPKQVVRNLLTCAHDAGNYLLNIGPKADGSIPPESVEILTKVGEWTKKNQPAYVNTERCQPNRSALGRFTRRGNTLYFNIYFYPGSSLSISGLLTKVKEAKILTTGQKVEFVQDKYSLKLTGLPDKAPDEPVTTIVLECESVPTQDNIFVRDRERNQVDI